MQRVIRNSGYLFTGSTLSAALSMIQGILAARLLGVESFGVLGIITVFVSVINRLTSFRMAEWVVNYVGEFSEKGEKDRAAAAFRLSAPDAWQDPQLMATAIDRLRMIVGDTPSVLLSRASHLLRFEPADPAALAKAMVLVGDVLEQTPDSAAAHLLLSRLLVAGPNPDFDRAAEHLHRALRFSSARAKRDFGLFASWHSDRESSDRYLRLIPRLGVAAASEALALLEPLLCVSPAGWLAVAEQWVKLGSRTNDYGHYERAAALVEDLPADSGEEWAIASRQLRGWIAFARGDLSLA